LPGLIKLKIGGVNSFAILPLLLRPTTGDRLKCLRRLFGPIDVDLAPSRAVLSAFRVSQRDAKAVPNPAASEKLGDPVGYLDLVSVLEVPILAANDLIFAPALRFAIGRRAV
jgi:hypothetical protein